MSAPKWLSKDTTYFFKIQILKIKNFEKSTLPNLFFGKKYRTSGRNFYGTNLFS